MTSSERYRRRPTSVEDEASTTERGRPSVADKNRRQTKKFTTKGDANETQGRTRGGGAGERRRWRRRRGHSLGARRGGPTRHLRMRDDASGLSERATTRRDSPNARRRVGTLRTRDDASSRPRDLLTTTQPNANNRQRRRGAYLIEDGRAEPGGHVARDHLDDAADRVALVGSRGAGEGTRGEDTHTSLSRIARRCLLCPCFFCLRHLRPSAVAVVRRRGGALSAPAPRPAACAVSIDLGGRAPPRSSGP